LLRGPAEFFAPETKEKSARKILILKLTEMGAIILAYPLMSQLQKRFPKSEIHFLTFERNAEVFTLLSGLVDKKHLLTISDQGVSQFFSDLWQVIKQLRSEEYDLVIDLEFFSRLSACLSFLTLAPQRLGFHRYAYEGLYRGNLFTHKLQYNPLLHISKTYLSMMQMLSVPRKDSPELEHAIDEADLIFPRWSSSAELKNKIRERMKAGGVDEHRVILLNPGEGAIPLREWPLENFWQVIQKILEDRQNFVILVGEKSDSGKSQELTKKLNLNRCLNWLDWMGETTMPELMTLFELSDALLINDCGLGHMASLTEIKSFILFGPETPQVFGPLGKHQEVFYSSLPCSPCLSILNHRRSFCRDNRCLKVIEPQAVFERITQSLKEVPTT
jgi:ADP-heptose:LPS heptosyltransferase